MGGAHPRPRGGGHEPRVGPARRFAAQPARARLRGGDRYLFRALTEDELRAARASSGRLAA
eukprot:4235003-Lingulodinium_polyedra.AAC.1